MAVVNQRGIATSRMPPLYKIIMSRHEETVYTSAKQPAQPIKRHAALFAQRRSCHAAQRNAAYNTSNMKRYRRDKIGCYQFVQRAHTEEQTSAEHSFYRPAAQSGMKFHTQRRESKGDKPSPASSKRSQQRNAPIRWLYQPPRICECSRCSRP
jgi:hypothetical protein